MQRMRGREGSEREDRCDVLAWRSSSRLPPRFSASLALFSPFSLACSLARNTCLHYRCALRLISAHEGRMVTGGIALEDNRRYMPSGPFANRTSPSGSTCVVLRSPAHYTYATLSLQFRARIANLVCEMQHTRCGVWCVRVCADAREKSGGGEGPERGRWCEAKCWFFLCLRLRGELLFHCLSRPLREIYVFSSFCCVCV